jgi:hypothetical protein
MGALGAWAHEAFDNIPQTNMMSTRRFMTIKKNANDFLQQQASKRRICQDHFCVFCWTARAVSKYMKPLMASWFYGLDDHHPSA